MSTVTPPPPHIPQVPTGGQASAFALVLGAPKGLEALQPGQGLEATVAALKAANQIQVQTSLGLLTLQTSLPLPKGAALTLVLSTLTPPTVQITTVNGKPAQASGPPAAQPGAQAAQGAAGAVSAPAPAQQLAPGQSITATLLRPALGVLQAAQGEPSATPTPQGGVAPNAAPAQTTTQATPSAGSPAVAGGAAKPAGQSAPQAPPQAPRSSAQSTQHPGGQQAAQAGGRPAVAPNATPGAQGATASPSAPAPQAPSTTAQGQSQAQPVNLPIGTRFNATVQKVDPPSTAVATTMAKAAGAPLAQGQVLSGAVTGRLAGGQPIVQTPAATFAMSTPGALTEGAKIAFRLDSAPQPPASAAPGLGASARTETANNLVTAKSWTDLTEALKALAGADPTRLHQVAQHSLPQPGAKLSNQMLFFLSALRGGDLRALFGDSATQVIDKERPGLLAKMSGDFQAMARLVDEPQQGDWRLALIPLWSGDKLEQLRFFWRGGRDEESGGDFEETRFVLDLELSNLGHLQIDGLVKAKRHHLDLIIRSEEPLPLGMRADITAIVQEAQTELNIGGQIAFQAKPANFVPLPQATGPEAPPGAGLLA